MAVMDAKVEFVVRMSVNGSGWIYAVDGPGSSLVAMDPSEAGHWREPDTAHRVATWWRGFFCDNEGCFVEVVRITTETTSEVVV